MDNMILLVFFYMSTQNKWPCLQASLPPPFFLGLGPLGPNLKFIDQLEEKVLRNLNFPKHQITLTIFFIQKSTHPPMLGTISTAQNQNQKYMLVNMRPKHKTQDLLVLFFRGYWNCSSIHSRRISVCNIWNCYGLFPPNC